VTAKGLNYYTGLVPANGKVSPGNILVAFLTGELSISSKLNICLENYFQYQSRGHFSGKLKNPTLGKKSSPKIGPIAQLITAPELEYTLTPNMGIIMGGAATIVGKNAPAFYSLLLAVLYMF